MKGDKARRADQVQRYLRYQRYRKWSSVFLLAGSNLAIASAALRGEARTWFLVGGAFLLGMVAGLDLSRSLR